MKGQTMEPRPSPDSGELLDDMLRAIERGQPHPCYLICGEEEYLIRKAADKIAAAILPSSANDLNLFFMDGDNENIDNLCNSLMTAPLLGGKKVILVRNTRIFHSRGTTSQLIGQIRINLDSDLLKAAKDFCLLLTIAGWSLDELAHSGWEKITDDEWSELIGERENAEERKSWLPKIVEFCMDHGLKATAKADQTELLGDVLSRGIPQDNHLILTTDAIDKRKKIYKIITQIGKVLTFTQAKGEAKQRFLVMEMARERLEVAEKKMTPGAWTAIGRKTGFSLRGSMEALDKLITYTGDRAVIQDADVDDVIGKTKEDTVFDLTGSLIKKDLAAALMSLDELLDRGTNHVQILSMMVREIRLLLHGKIYLTSGVLKSFDQKMDYNRFQKAVYPAVKEMAAGKSREAKHLAGMHPYVIYNTLRGSGRFSKDALIAHLDELVDIDIALKTTARDPKLLLERFIVKFCE
ncbi:MAG: DNA polymerase III subunit delta [Deltaproteobacteria bacterium]|nr:DNA polymerase III subunit delta [Deltaproteobacteria bacterium]